MRWQFFFFAVARWMAKRGEDGVVRLCHPQLLSCPDPSLHLALNNHHKHFTISNVLSDPETRMFSWIMNLFENELYQRSVWQTALAGALGGPIIWIGCWKLPHLNYTNVKDVRTCFFLFTLKRIQTLLKKRDFLFIEGCVLVHYYFKGMCSLGWAEVAFTSFEGVEDPR